MTYDAAGDLTSLAGATLTYDNFGHVSSAGSATFTYDSAGRRVSKTVNGHTVFTLYDGSTPIAEVDSSGNIQTSYTWGAQGLISDHIGAGSRFYKFDAVGNTRALLDESGSVLGTAAYTAWGSTTTNTLPATPFTWAGQFGQHTDSETGLVLCGVRYYAPSMGRFISRDPSGFRVGPNVYAYCCGDPIDFHDRTGLEEDPTDDVDTFGGGLADGLRPWAAGEEALLEPYNQIHHFFPFLAPVPAIGPLEAAVSLHDAFYKWGYDVGSQKASAEQVCEDGFDAMLQAGGAVAGLAGPALAGIDAFTVEAPALGSGNAYSVAWETTLPRPIPYSWWRHFKACNENLIRAMDASPELERLMNKVIPDVRGQIQGPNGGISCKPPEDWTWHHNPTAPGVMQLVPTVQHAKGSICQELLHPLPYGGGGMSTWAKEWAIPYAIKRSN